MAPTSRARLGDVVSRSSSAKQQGPTGILPAGPLPAPKRTDLRALRPAKWNPRAITKERFANLVASLKSDPAFLAVNPIVATKSGTVFIGNMRLRAALELGWKTVPAVQVDVDERTAKRWALIDNNGWGENDEQQLGELLYTLGQQGVATDLLGFDKRDLDKLMDLVGANGEQPPDVVIEPPAKPITKPGDLIALGEHRLFCGDGADPKTYARILRAEQVALTFTSPPYAVGVEYGDTYDDTIDSLRALLPRLAKTLYAITLDGGAAVVNFGDVVSAAFLGLAEPCEYPMALEYWPAFRDADWTLYTRRVWAKPHARVHSPWAIRSSRAASDWEHLWTWKKAGIPRTTRGTDSAFGVWDTSHEEGVEIGKDRFGAGMATSLAVRAIMTHSRRGDLVLDPLAGTGTTLIAADQAARRCLSVEISPAYCDVIVNRWENRTHQKAERKAA